jgi:hypothetical protein
VLSYGFEDTTGCGTSASDLAGRNGNRASFSDVKSNGHRSTFRTSLGEHYFPG